MSRIKDALARAQRGEAAKAADGDGSLPWDFGTARPAETSSPWDFSASRAAELTASVPEKSTALAQPKAAVHVLADTSQRPVIPIHPAESDYAEKLIVATHLPGGLVDQYRRLGAALHQAQTEHGIRVVMVASAMPAEGKTLVSSNLALVLSNSYGRRVLLMDGDLRRPSLHTVFGVENTSGIADRLEDERAGTLPPVALSATLDLLVAGKPHPDPLRIVTSGAMQRLIQDAAAKYEWVILDTPPVGLLPDAHLLASMVDRVLLVIEAGKTPYNVIQKSITMIGKERIIGSVLNRAEASVASPYDARYDQHYTTSAR